jgi:hypothetical protein
LSGALRVRIHIKICLRAAQNNDGEKMPGQASFEIKRKIYGARRAKNAESKIEMIHGQSVARARE